MSDANLQCWSSKQAIESSSSYFDDHAVVFECVKSKHFCLGTEEYSQYSEVPRPKCLDFSQSCQITNARY